MLEDIKTKVYEANLLLPKYDLVKFTWGNVSEISRDRKYVVIKPSGLSYDNMRAEDMVVVDLEGNIVEGELNPSSDTKTHLALYKRFPEIGGITHTHSRWATTMSESKLPLIPMSTTQADYFYGEVPLTRDMTKGEIESDYELETGNVIIETFEEKNISPKDIPGVLVSNHGPFTFGKDAKDSVFHSVVLEEISFMNRHAHALNKDKPMSDELLDKHYLRKHGENAYYGQKK